MSGALGVVVRVVRMVQGSDRDAVIVISGWTGEGKSTLSVQLGKPLDSKFGFWRNLVYSRKQTDEAINSLPNRSVVGVDEAINVLYKRDFMYGEQKDLIKLFNMCRDKNHCLILNIPVFWDLDSAIRHDRIRFWIWVSKRGEAYLFRPEKNPFSTDPWHKKLNEKLFRKGRIAKSPNFVGILNFEKMSEEEFAEYLRVKAEKKALALKEEKERKTEFERGKEQGLKKGYTKGYFDCALDFENTKIIRRGDWKRFCEDLSKPYRPFITQLMVHRKQRRVRVIA